MSDREPKVAHFGIARVTPQCTGRNFYVHFARSEDNTFMYDFNVFCLFIYVLDQGHFADSEKNQILID